MHKGFFDTHNRFTKTSQTGGYAERLNWRYRAIIESNSELISGARVLDIASHDARWTFAAISAGAERVVGVEAREHLIKHGYDNMMFYNVPPEKYELIQRGIHEAILEFSPHEFDVVFCLGFLYHTPKPFWLLEQIARLNPHTIVLDVKIFKNKEPVVKLTEDETEIEGSAVAIGKKKTLVFLSSVPAIKMMLEELGYDQLQFFPWDKVFAENPSLRNEKHMVDYRTGERVTITAKKNTRNKLNVLL